MKKFIIVYVLFFFWGQLFSQQKYYVREWGSDGYTVTGTMESPFKTVNYALSACAIEGDTIDVLGTIISADSLGVFNKAIAINNQKSVTIIGHGKDSTILQPAPSYAESQNRIFSISGGAKVKIQDLTMRWGNAYPQASQDGGNIAVWESELELDNVLITKGYARHGGGLDLRGTNGGSVIIRNSVITENEATTFGGGVHCKATGSQGTNLEVHASLISGNKTLNASSRGAGFYFDSYESLACVYSIYNSTIAFNENSTIAAGISMSSNLTAPIKLTLWNNTIAYNKSTAIADVTGLSGAGGFSGYATRNVEIDMLNNLFIENTGKPYGKPLAIYDANFNGPTLTRIQNSIFTNSLPQWYIEHPAGGQVNSDPAATNKYVDNTQVMLATELADNQGKTQTLALNQNSVAINAGTYIPIPFMAYDQRGVERDFTYDIGAYEYKVASATNDLRSNNTMAFYDRMNNRIVCDNQNSIKIQIFDISGALLSNTKVHDNIFNVDYLRRDKLYVAVITNEKGEKNVLKFIR